MIANLLLNLNRPALPCRAFIGLDGFVDEIIHIVDKRFSPESYQRIRKIGDYAARIERAATMSTNIELVSLKTKMGGNGTILANALLNYGIEVTYMGSIGYPLVDPIMEPLQRCKRLIGLAQPAFTDALEFEDGKIITSKLTPLDSITWERIRERVPLPELVTLFQESDLIVFSNWSMILGMNDIWRRFLDEIAPLLNCRGKTVFFDLADPEKRTRADLTEALSLIRSFTHPGFRVILSLNLKEACEIGETLGLDIPDYRAANITAIINALQEKLELDCVVVHPADRAACLDRDSYEEVKGPYCRQPAITTGAGDHFNAGFLYGVLEDFPMVQCLLLGCATSGYYVRRACSPTKNEIVKFLSAWEENRLDN